MKQLLLPPVFVLLVSGCAAVRPCVGALPETATRDQVTRTSFRTEAPDQTCLQAYEWKSAQPVKGVVVVEHGIRDHASRYSALAEALAAKGLAVYGQDLRGHGSSGGNRQRFDSIDELVGDLDLAVSEAKKRNPGLPVFLYGHSLGGLISTHYALAHGTSLKGLVLSGAALKLPTYVTGGEKAAARFFSVVIPGLKAQRVDDTVFVREPAAKAELAADPQVDHFDLPARSAAAGLDAIDDVQTRMEEVKVPLLIMHGSADQGTNIEGSRELNQRAASADKTLKIWDGLFHDLLHEPERDQVISTVDAWISARL
jgi:acylglycerol lipase